MAYQTDIKIRCLMLDHCEWEPGDNTEKEKELACPHHKDDGLSQVFSLTGTSLTW